MSKYILVISMKKVFCVALFFMLLFTITACGNDGNKENVGIKPEFSTNAPAPSDGEPEDSKGLETEAGAVQTEIQQAESTQENAEQEVTEMKMKIQVEKTTFWATLAENSSVDALKALMAEGPLTLNMSDYAGMEKGADLVVTLPQNNEPMNTQPGDIILYQGRTLVIYYACLL